MSSEGKNSARLRSSTVPQSDSASATSSRSPLPLPMASFGDRLLCSRLLISTPALRPSTHTRKPSRHSSAAPAGMHALQSRRGAAGASTSTPSAASTLPPFPLVCLLANLMLLATAAQPSPAQHAPAYRVKDWKQAVGSVGNCFNALSNNSQLRWFSDPFPITKRPLRAFTPHGLHGLHSHSGATRVVSSLDLYTTEFPEDVPMPASLAGKKALTPAELHEVMASLLSRQVITDRAMYARALHRPSEPALQKFAAKLLSGQAVKIMVQGTSHAAGHGILPPFDRELYNFPASVFRWVQSIFPNPGHKLVNRALAGSRSHKDLDLSGEPDLILVEFGASDGYLKVPIDENPLRIAYEALLRSMLMLPNQPDILVTHWWAANTGWAQYYESPQDQMSPIARYYDLPQISWRDAVYELMLRGPERSFDNAVPGFEVNQLYCDACGHGNLVGNRYFSDLIIEYLAEAILMQVVHTSSHADPDSDAPSSVPLKQAIFPENDQTPVFAMWWHGNGHLAIREVVKTPLPPEWLWTEEGRHHKWGYVTRNHSGVLELEIPMAPCKAPVEVMTVGLSFLMSYEHMGRAMAECSGCGCESRPVELNAHHDERTSVDGYYTWSNITLLEPAAPCKIRVWTLGADVNPPGHDKFKVTGASMACLSPV